MKNLTVILALFMCVFMQLTGQEIHKITGTIIDKSTQELIEQATVRLLSQKDSTYISGAGTNKEGKFTINSSPGKYILNISYLGYNTLYKKVEVKENNLDLGSIYLSTDGIMLQEAVITAKAPEVTVKGDTVEYNADSYKVQESAVVEDLLKKMPGAEIDSDGKITVNGKEVKKILVDGKEFFSDDPKVASKNLPASMVDKLQVLDKKSDMAQMTGFDDGEEETVINLTVKKGMKQGVFGSASAGIGNHGRYETNAMVNYMQNENQFTLLGGSNNTNNGGFSDFATSSFASMRPIKGLSFGGDNGIAKSSNGGFNFAINPSEKFKWGGNIRYGNTHNDVETTSNTQNYISEDSGGDQYEIKKSYGYNKSNNINADMRFEWRPDSATTIIFRPNIQYNENTNAQKNDYITTHFNLGDSINWGKSDYFSDGHGTTLNGILEISRELGKKGRRLSVHLEAGHNQLDNSGYNKSATYFSNLSSNSEIIDQIFNQRNKGYNLRGHISYVEPLKNNYFIQVAYHYKKIYSETNKISYNNNGSNTYNQIDTAATRKLENDFRNQQIEINFKSVRPKYDYTIGVALQPSNSQSWTYAPDTAWVTNNKVLNFSPVARFTYRWDKRKQLRLDYKGTTSQPTTTQLSSVPDLSDPLNITYGNPDLKPTFNNRFRITYREFNPEKASAFLVFGGFNFSMNDIVSYSLVDEQAKRESTYRNVNGNWNADLRVILNRPLSNQKFSINSMTYGQFSKNNGYINGKKNTLASTTFQENAGLEYRSSLFDFGLRGNFRFVNRNNSLQGQENRSTYNYGGTFNTTLYLPFDFTIDTDMNYSANAGYSNGYKQNEWLWNASVSKQIFKAKNGTIKLKIYDILQQRSNISQTATAQYLRETITNTINSYFMLSFVYKFQIFKGGAKQSEMRQGPGRFGPPPPRPF